MARSIKEFSGKHRFLSNFHEHPKGLLWRGVTAPTVEHHFQGYKTIEGSEREWVLEAPTPIKAKRRGQRVTLRPEWDDIRLGVMAELIHTKFEDRELRKLLDDTGNATLIEGNSRHDTFWGRCDCDEHEFRGYNWLGRLLTIERSRRRFDIAPPF